MAAVPPGCPRRGKTSSGRGPSRGVKRSPGEGTDFISQWRLGGILGARQHPPPQKVLGVVLEHVTRGAAAGSSPCHRRWGSASGTTRSWRGAALSPPPRFTTSSAISFNK